MIRMSMTMQIVHRISEGSPFSGKLFNAAHVFSSLNRKMMPPVDAQGNAQVFGLRIQAFSTGANTVTIQSASNSYVTKQAVKSWHRVWKAKMKEGGYSMKDLGPYGRVFKPRLEATDSLLGSGLEAGRGEWNYSDIVTVPAATGGSDAVSGAELTDQFALHLIGSSVLEDTGDDETRQYSSVGMIESWLGSRRKRAGAAGGDGSEVQEDDAFDQDNPLLLARGGTFSSEQLLDEVRDLQKDEPPYTESDFQELYTQALITSDANLSNVADVMAPCGHLKIWATAGCTLMITLIGITDM